MSHFNARKLSQPSPYDKPTVKDEPSSKTSEFGHEFNLDFMKITNNLSR